MNGSLQYSALTRLLTLNSRVHDLRKQLLGTSVPLRWQGASQPDESEPPCPIARIQEEIDQGVRASLATCWLAAAGDPEE